MLRHVVAISFAVTLLAGPALADTIVLQPGQDFSGQYGRAEDSAHMLQMDPPADLDAFPDSMYDAAFLTEVSIMARTYGDVSGIYGSVVVYRPGEDADGDKLTSFPEAGETIEGSLEILGTYIFPLTDVGEGGGWFTAQFEPFPVSTEFCVAVYAYSDAEHGLEVGLSTPMGGQSSSGWFFRSKERDDEERVITTTQTLRMRGDSREWMARASFTDSVASGHAVNAETLSGSGFDVYDDGTAEGFITTQRYGPMLHIVADGPQVIDTIYIYGKLSGSWFESEHKGGLYLMDMDYRLISTKRIPYNLFTNNEAWTAITMGSGVKVPQEFFLLIEPNSRPKVKLMVGYDASSTNMVSTFGTAGSELDWETEAPEESTNWMIRIHYK